MITLINSLERIVVFPPNINRMTFAPAEHVKNMRQLLLDAGAIEDAELKERWVQRRNADACEDAWLRNFHGDPR